uniref:Uncharacterized protein n=1 Tax=viral metagenome TaxID=1070528 RepID=A0A6C0BD89_9ZZZZ
MLHNNFSSDKYVEPVISDKTATQLGNNITNQEPSTNMPSSVLPKDYQQPLTNMSSTVLPVNYQQPLTNMSTSVLPVNYQQPLSNMSTSVLPKDYQQPLSNMSTSVLPKDYQQPLSNMSTSVLPKDYQQPSTNIPSSVLPKDYQQPLTNSFSTKIIVEIVRSNGKIIFYDNTRKYIGSFTINEFFRYLTNPDVEIEYKMIIEKYICVVSINKTVNMLNCEQSAFMGNISILLKFYMLLNDFENSELQKMLKLYPETENIFNETVYNILLHMLKTIALILNRMSNENMSSYTHQKTKNKLLTHSTGIVYKLTKLNKTMIDNKIKEINMLKLKEENTVIQKTTSLTDILDLQDRKFNKNDFSFSDLMMSENNI